MIRPRFALRRRFDARVLHAFPVASGSSIRALDHGARSFEPMISAIDAAVHWVDVEMYLWHDDAVGRSFADALLRAARRGLPVRVLVDAHGASEAEDLLAPLVAAGADLRLFSPFRFGLMQRYIHRTHKKLLVVDGRVAFAGGAGFSTHWTSGKNAEPTWHDRMFEIRGRVIDQLEAVIDADFSRWDPAGPEVPQHRRFEDEAAPSGRSELRVLRGWPDARDFPAVLLAAVRAATARIWLGTPYFVPTRTLRSALREAAGRGVDVRVIHPSRNHAHPFLWYAARARYGRLLRAGIGLFEYQPCFYHAKLAIVDRSLAIVGSSNLDPWSLSRNAEIDIALSDAPTVDSIAEMFRADEGKSRAVTEAEAGFRGLLDFAGQRVSLWFERWM